VADLGVGHEPRGAKFTRDVLTMTMSANIFAGLAALAGPSPSAQAGVTFQTLDNNADLTFNQLLGINNSGEIAGYFGIGFNAHPNKGYNREPPYGQGTANTHFLTQERPNTGAPQ
jgi:hypothetical protein